MTDPKIKIIKGTGPTLSLAQLEKASAKLLVSRIRGHEPQISFTFVQRLLDELIRRRREEADTKFEIDCIVEDLEKEEKRQEEEIKSEDVETLMSADIEVLESIDASPQEELGIPEDLVLDEDSPLRAAVEAEELEPEEGEKRKEASEEEEEEEEDLEIIPPEETLKPRRRRPILACSRPRHTILESELNVGRVLLISLLAAFAMICGVFLMGCKLGGGIW